MTLPQSWAVSSIGALADKGQYGWTTKAAQAGEVRFLRTTDITKGRIDWSSVPFCAEVPADLDKYLLEPGDIVISRAGSVGFSRLMEKIPCNTVFASYLIRFKPSSTVVPRYLAAYLNSDAYWKGIGAASVGIALANVNAKSLAALPVPLAPLAEQKRIADKLDTVLTRVDAVNTRLARVAPLLKRFRQSVLAAATSGRLTEDWRQQNSFTVDVDAIAKRRLVDFESNSALRKQWRNREPDNLQLSGADQYNQTQTPSTWLWITLKSVATLDKFAIVDGPFGSDLKSSDYVQDGKYPVLTISMMYDMKDMSAARYVSTEKFEQLTRSKVEGGDILVAKIGSTYGLACLYPPNAPTALIPANMCKITCDNSVALTQYTLLWLKSTVFKAHLDGIVSFSAQPAFNVGNFKSLPIPLPPLIEQTEIVRRVETLFAFADRLEARLAQAQTAATRLTPALLAKAFRGELVPQDPNDEPAAELLRRLQAERATAPKASAGRGRKAAVRSEG